MPPISLSRFRFILGLLLTGILSGFGGMLLAIILHGIQHLAYGYSLSHVISEQSFLDGVSVAPPLRRFMVLVLCGLVAGTGWYLLYRYGRKLVSITAAIKAERPDIPVWETLAHVMLQIITVGLGSPLGREVAPRELGALSANLIGDALGLSAAQTRILIACGAGGGLAAVYNVPLGGALFIMEVLLASTQLRLCVYALFSCAIAALVARSGLGDEYQYHITMPLSVSGNLIVWSVLTGPLFGLAAWLFVQLTYRAKQAAPKDGRLIIWNLLNFSLMGVLIIWLPQLAGNGKGPAELSFTSQLGIALALLLLACKVFLQWGSLRAGAQGGLLTPGLANGALLAIVLGGVWNLMFPGNSPGAYAIIGAAAFLAASMSMPFTSLVLIIEFTRINEDFFIPLALSISGALAMHHWLEQRKKPT